MQQTFYARPLDAARMYRAMCASNVAAAKFKSLRGKMDGLDQSEHERLSARDPDWRTDLYARPTSGTLLP